MTRHLGLDLGGTNIKWCVLEADDIVARVADGSMATDARSGPVAVARRLVKAGEEANARHGPFASIGLGVPGLFERSTGVVTLFPNLPGPWKGFPLREKVSEGLDSHVTMINDARAFTIAESTLGAGKGCSIVVAMVLGTGVGGGITIDGRLHLGAFGTAGELGHQTVMPDGPMCGCGNQGCVEALTRADALAALAGKASAEEVYEAAALGDTRCRDAISEVAEYLGIALANTVTVIGPERIVIGGGIAAAGDLLLVPLREAIKKRVTLVPIDQVSVVLAELGSAAGAIGAALAGMAQDDTRAR
jgi:glucokinase